MFVAQKLSDLVDLINSVSGSWLTLHNYINTVKTWTFLKCSHQSDTRDWLIRELGDNCLRMRWRWKRIDMQLLMYIKHITNTLISSEPVRTISAQEKAVCLTAPCLTVTQLVKNSLLLRAPTVPHCTYKILPPSNFLSHLNCSLPFSPRPIFEYFYINKLVSQVAFSLPIFWLKFCILFKHFPCILHVLPNSPPLS